MAVSDTARLLSTLELQDKFSGTAKAGVAALGGLESKSNFVTRGFGLMGQAGGAVGNALGTLKGRIGQLISGPLGMLGLGAGLFGVGKFLTDAVTGTQDFAKEVGRLAALTGLGTEQTSKLAGAFEHFGIETDQALTIVGFAEKTLGKLTATGANAQKQTDDLASAQRDLTLAQLKLNEAQARYGADSSQVLAAQNRVMDAQDALNTLVEDGGVITGGAAGFFNKYGLALTDASGKTKDFNTLLLDSADFFNNKSIPAETKAAALATIYGKSWQTLIPILSAGREGISDAEDEAAALGLTLTKDNLTALAKLKTATRDWGTALGGLKLQLGLAVIPLLTDLTTGAFNFLKTADQFGVTGSQKIVGFFKDVITFGEKAFGIITDKVVPIVKQVIDGWNNLPEPLKGLLVKGVSGNFAIKFLLGFDPIAIAGSAATAIAGKLAGAAAGSLAGFVGDFFGKVATNKLIPQAVALVPGVTPIPVFVTNPGFGLPGGGGAPTGGIPPVAGFPAIGLGTIAVGLVALLGTGLLIAGAEGVFDTPAGRKASRDTLNALKENGFSKWGTVLPEGFQGINARLDALNAKTDAATAAAADLAREKGARGLFPFDTLPDVPREKEARGLFPFNTQDDVARERMARGLIDLADTALAPLGSIEKDVAKLPSIEESQKAILARLGVTLNTKDDVARERQARIAAASERTANKNFSPTISPNINVTIPITNNVSISAGNVVRTLTSYTAALGSGVGGAVPNPY